MKVCTDACLFGAWIAEKEKSKNLKGKNVLDIGTGTGLLSLMFAQKNPLVIIDAVEIDETAAQQAKENFDASPWKDRLNIYNTSIQQFSDTTIQPFHYSTKYDLIISNPPFFENDLKANDAKRNVALHAAELGLEELLNEVSRRLKDDGSIAVLLPFHRTEQFVRSARQKDFHLKEKVFLKQTPKHLYFRSLLLFSKEKADANECEIIIQDNDGEYTKKFVELLKDYYLYL